MASEAESRSEELQSNSKIFKARCEGDGNAPCRRCQTTNRDCIYDELSTKKREQNLEETSSQAPKKTRYIELEEEVSKLRSVVDALLSRPQNGDRGDELESPATSTGPQTAENSASGNAHQVNHDCRSNIAIATENMSRGNHLNLLQLNAPITAIHAITSPSPAAISASSQSQGQPSPANLTSTSSLRSRFSTSEPIQTNKDAISKNLITESRARRLFHMYMTGANVFLPFFDPSIDTFEAVRQTSPSCFTVILSIALRLDRVSPDSDKLCSDLLSETHQFAAQSLFAVSAQLDTIQAMVLLAAYSEKNWFSICHARQMGLDLGLDRLLPELPGELQQQPTNLKIHRVKSRHLARAIRTWLILHHVEQEVAAGVARSSTMDPIRSQTLRPFLKHQYTIVSDIRILSTVEVVQLRGRILREINVLEKDAANLKAKIENYREDIDRWYIYWDTMYEEHDINPDSFQRKSLRVQNGYAMIIACSAMISKLGREGTQEMSTKPFGKESHFLVEMTIKAISQQLDLVTQSESYKWHLQWAPTYSALMLAFIAALALRLVKLHPHMTNWSSLLVPACIAVTNILEEHPNQNFALLIRGLLKANPNILPSGDSTIQSDHVFTIEQNINMGSGDSEAENHHQNVFANPEDGQLAPHQCRRPSDDTTISTITHNIAASARNPSPRLQQGSWPASLEPVSPFQRDSVDIEQHEIEPGPAMFSDWMLDFNTFAESFGTTANDYGGFFH